APEDREILDAIESERTWICDLLASLVREPTTLGEEERGQAVVRDALRGLRLSPVDVRMDADAIRAHPSHSPFDWDVSGKTNAVAAVIAEPFGAAITTGQVGVLWFDVRIAGVAGHAAEGGNAVNAIERSLWVIGALRELERELNVSPPAPFDRFTHPINLNVGAIEGGDWP